jgi:hypothetical protein
MTDWDHDLHEGLPGFGRPGDNRTGDDIRALLFDAVPGLSENERLALFDRTFDPATPDPEFDVPADTFEASPSAAPDAGADTEHHWPEPAIDPVEDPAVETFEETWTDHGETIPWEDL